ncbi:MAG: TonB-dependent receptor [Caulobacteraceae bacterium]|nr:TonB-dependent receptor [Caulobacteraceae bacterium]
MQALKSRILHASSLALASFVAVNAAHAAAPAAGTQLGEIVVTAQKRSELLSRVPAAVVAISGEKLAASGISDIRTLDTAVAGVMFSSNGTVASPSIRGIGSTQYSPLGGPAVGMNIDGVPIDGMVAANGAFYDLERVEVMKGPQGTLYGRNSTAGVVNIVSKQPVLDQYTGDINTEFGNYSSRRVDGGVNIPLGATAALRIAGLYAAHDAYMSNGYDDANDAAARAQLLFKPMRQFTLLVGLDYFHQGGRGAADVPLPLGSRGTVASNPYEQNYYPNPSDAKQDNRIWGVHAEATADLGFGTLVVIPSYRELDRDQVSYQGSFRSAVRDYDRQTSLEARLSGRTGPAEWILGAYLYGDLHHYDADYVNPSSCAGAQLLQYAAGDCLTINGQRSRLPSQSEAAFGQVTYNVTDRARLTAGLRYTEDRRSAKPNLDYTLYPFVGGPPIVVGSPIPAPQPPDLSNPLVGIVSENATGKFNNLSYKVGAEYDLASHILLYVNISSGYKAGGVNDGNATLYKPETLLSYEAGVRAQLFENKLRLHVNTFYWDYRNHQEGGVYYVPPIGVLYQITNIPKGRIYGVDLEADWRPTAFDALGGQISYLESDTGPFSLPTGAQSLTGHPYINSPKWTVNLNYSHRFEFGDWLVEPAVETHIVSSYNTDFRFDPATHQDGYHKTDLNVTFRPRQGHWYVGAFVRNLENKVVITAAQAAPGQGAPQYWGYLSDPRTYGVRLGASF